MEKQTRKVLIRVILHVLAWAVLLGLPFYTMKRFEVGNDLVKAFFAISLMNGLIFYANYLIIVPRFFFQKRKFKYYLSVAALVICFYFVTDLTMKMITDGEPEKLPSGRVDTGQKDRREPIPPRGGFLGVRIPFHGTHIAGYISSSVFLIFFSLGLRVMEKQAKIEMIQEELEKEKLNSELAFLKNQVSPHFFFNTLNNIYSLIGINPDDSQNAVLKLSKLMRYLIYESEHGNTTLEAEIAFMNNYIDLMKLRTSEKVSLNVRFPQNFTDREIPPLLFIAFIENAFKHGISSREKSFIDISMVIEDDSIIFTCSNSLHQLSEDVALRSEGGIGLGNVKKRLSLLFPGKHDLRITRSEVSFNVILTINQT